MKFGPDELLQAMRARDVVAPDAPRSVHPPTLAAAIGAMLTLAWALSPIVQPALNRGARWTVLAILWSIAAVPVLFDAGRRRARPPGRNHETRRRTSSDPASRSPTSP